jgi:hypothetical protein
VLKFVNTIRINFADAASLLLLVVLPATSWAQSTRRAASYGVGPTGSSLDQTLGAAATQVWVDRVVKTFIEGWTEYNPSTCTDISPGSYTVLTAPTHGKLFFDVENGTLANGDCPGVTFPFAVARYTWTDPSNKVLQDPFTLQWSTPDGQFTQTNSFTAELAKIVQSKSIWWVCGVTRAALPNTGTLTLQNAPAGATSFAWSVTAGSDKLVFSNGSPTITTATATSHIKSLAASTALKDVKVKVIVNSLTYSFGTDVRTPKQLKRRTDLDSDQGRGASCAVAGTQGWQSFIGYEVDDQFAVNTAKPDNANAGINEQFGAKTNNQANNWPIPAEGGSDTPGGLFSDNMCITTNAFMPNPQPPQAPLTANMVDQIAQTWRSGDSTTPADHKGCKVQTDAFTRYIDHGRHLNIVSPAAAVADPGTDAGLTPTSTGYPVPVLNVRDLAEQSTVIVKGRTLKVNQALQEAIALVSVDKALKGRVSGKIIAVRFSRDPAGSQMNLEEGEYAMLFLKSNPDGRYSFAEPQAGKIAITSRNVAWADSQTTAVKLEAELFASLSDSNREVARSALAHVGDLQKVRSTQAIREIAAVGNPDYQGLAYVALLKLGDYSLLDRAIIFAEQPVQDPEVWRPQMGVIEAISEIEEPSVLPTLHSLLASPLTSLRRAAAKAVRTISDPSSVPFMVRALDDTDVDVQYDAVMGLAAIDGSSSDNAPARDLFNHAPARYVGHWKVWWETAGKRKYAPAR